ncbi:hypothetical protein KC19_VG306600 [Ceratodon purpureus]|uniref:Uncharacterized protein n=1 Tax=Ceratodon purpureus TaxID=3225 RepID=A0A8T0HX55_CERPU|nr:hypothetical protein KC19_VG306600 [Ceratodon purpureus]
MIRTTCSTTRALQTLHQFPSPNAPPQPCPPKPIPIAHSHYQTPHHSTPENKHISSIPGPPLPPKTSPKIRQQANHQSPAKPNIPTYQSSTQHPIPRNPRQQMTCSNTQSKLAS